MAGRVSPIDLCKNFEKPAHSIPLPRKVFIASTILSTASSAVKSSSPSLSINTSLPNSTLDVGPTPLVIGDALVTSALSSISCLVVVALNSTSAPSSTATP